MYKTSNPPTVPSLSRLLKRFNKLLSDTNILMTNNIGMKMASGIPHRAPVIISD